MDDLSAPQEVLVRTVRVLSDEKHFFLFIEYVAEK